MDDDKLNEWADAFEYEEDDLKDEKKPEIDAKDLQSLDLEQDDLITDLKNPKKALFDDSKIKIKRKKNEEESIEIIQNEEQKEQRIDDLQDKITKNYTDTSFDNLFSSFNDPFSTDTIQPQQNLKIPSIFKKDPSYHTNVYNALIDDVLSDLFSYLSFFYFASIRNNIYINFLKSVLPLLNFGTKKDKPGSFWMQKNILLAQEIINKSFLNPNFFLKPFNTYEEFINQENYKNWTDLILSLSDVYFHLLKLDNNNHYLKFKDSFKDILNKSIKNHYDTLKHLLLFNDGFSDINDPESYFSDLIQVADVRSWFVDPQAVYEKLIWNNNQNAILNYEDGIQKYYAKKLYLSFGAINYLFKHPSLSNFLDAYRYDTFNDINITNPNHLKELELENIASPLILLYYKNDLDSLSSIMLHLNEHNNFVQFVDIINTSFNNFNMSKTTSYLDVLKHSTDVSLTIQGSKLYLTQLPHLLSNDDDVFNFLTMRINNTLINKDAKAMFDNEFVLQLTTYNTFIRASQYVLLIQDDESDIEVSKNKDLAKTNERKIQQLEKTKQKTNDDDLSIDLQNDIYNTKANLVNESLLLKQEYSLISFNEVFKYLNDLITNWYKQIKINKKN